MASAEIGVTRTVVFRRKPEGKAVDEEKWKGVVRAVRATAGVEGQAWVRFFVTRKETGALMENVLGIASGE